MWGFLRRTIGFGAGSEGVVGGVDAVEGGVSDAGFVGKSSSSISTEDDCDEAGSFALTFLAEGLPSEEE